MDVVIVGGGGHGKVVLDILRAAGKDRPVGFLDADPVLAGKSIHGLPVLGQINLIHKLKSQRVAGAIVAIGDNLARHRYAQTLLQQGLELVNAVHPSAVISPSATVGQNVVVAAGSVIGPDTVISDSVIINTGALIDHECRIDRAVHVCPGAALAGRVQVGEFAFVGLGCRIIQCLIVGRQATVGAGAVVIEDVPELAAVVGVPARIIKTAQPYLAEACPA